MKQFMPQIPKIKYEGPDSRNPLAFRWYNPSEKINGKTMRDHLRFAVAYWHSFRGTGADPFGGQTIIRPWDDGSATVENAQRRMQAAFEFIQKLGADYYCFHDRDIAPEGATLTESNRNLDAVAKVAKQLQKDTGIKLLWGTANLFSHPRYMCGASTNPDAHVVAYAAAQVKKALEVTKELGGQNYVFWGGREGYQTLLNTDMKRELDHMGAFLRMVVEYKKQIGFKGTFLIEPKPKEPTRHQYDFDSATVISFLRAQGLEKEFKLNIEANHATLAGHSFEHELQTASDNKMLGSIDANTGDPLLGWDTDQFNLDLRSTTLAMLIVLEQGGIAPGGLNFDAKVRRESVTIEDLFIAHISSMDSFARGLRIAAKIQKDGALKKLIKNRYASFNSGIGKKIETGKTSLVALEKYILTSGEPATISGRQEQFEQFLDSYL